MGPRLLGWQSSITADGSSSCHGALGILAQELGEGSVAFPGILLRTLSAALVDARQGRAPPRGLLRTSADVKDVAVAGGSGLIIAAGSRRRLPRDAVELGAYLVACWRAHDNVRRLRLVVDQDYCAQLALPINNVALLDGGGLFREAHESLVIRPPVPLCDALAHSSQPLPVAHCGPPASRAAADRGTRQGPGRGAGNCPALSGHA